MQTAVRYYFTGSSSALGWDLPMPRIIDDVLNCVVYLYRSKHEAEEGINIGGSGFLLGVPTERLPPPAGFTYVVTNAHVIKAKCNFMRVNTFDGKCKAIETKNWLVSNVDDLAICAIPELDHAKFTVRTIGRDMLVTEKFIHDENIGPGDEVALMGRFVNLEGKERNTPTVRFGHISQMPIEPLEYDGQLQESFLCEIKSVGGFSGSPVFLAPISDTGRPDGSKFRDQARLLGVDWCHVQNFAHAIDEHGNKIPHIGVPENTGMMGVVPAWKLNALLDDPRENEMRDMNEDAEIKRRRAPKVSLDVSQKSFPPANDENPNHREDFTRLVGAAARKRERED
jgi:hypothetical protein